MSSKSARNMLRALTVTASLGALSGCVYGPPPPVAYAQPAPAYYAAPGYYAAPAYPAYGYYGGPAVDVDIGGRGYRRWR